MCIATQRKKNNDPLAMMALRDTQLLTGQCVKTGRIQKLRLNFLVAEAAARADATRDYPLARQHLTKSRQFGP